MSTIEWNEETAAHLYRRAAFGATASELAQAVQYGLDGAVNGLVDYEMIPNAALDLRLARMNLDFEATSLQSYIDIVRWWITRLIYSARPLEERMTFFWHNHFATSVEKVGESDLVKNQNELFRRYALGNFRNLCTAVARDPAMLFWLDNYTSVKDHPNENFGRELQELFTLGRGHYSEDDVKAASRAFTGWTIDRNYYPVIFRFNDDDHDHGQKTFLGQTGDFDGNDIVRIICDQEQHGRFMAAKLFAFFAYDDPEPDVIDRFARIYLDSGTEVKPLVRAILLSPEMYSPRAMWSKIKSPLEHVLMACHLLQTPDELPSARAELVRQNQILFSPPDVSGWPHGIRWITASALLSRMNFANDAVVDFDPLKFGIGSNPSVIVGSYLHNLGPLNVVDATRQQLIDYLAPGGVFPEGWTLITRLRGLAHVILSLPEWQIL
jgi:uncharacterized protein (DUF1800 family)